MAKAIVKTLRLTPRGARRNAERKLSTNVNQEAKLVNKLATLDAELSKIPDNSIINHTKRMNISREKADVQKELNALRKQKITYENRLVSYNSNDEQVLKDRQLYWGA